MLCANRTITLFHHTYNERTDADAYVGLVITGVSIYEKPIVAASTGGLIANDTFTIRIPSTAHMCGKRFATAKEYAASVDKTPLWTIAPGDIIVLCRCDAVITDNFKFADLLSQFDTCTVMACRDRRNFAMPHIIIEGK